MSTPYNADKTIHRHSTRSSLVTIFESNVPAGEDKQVKSVLGEPLDSVPADMIISDPEYPDLNASWVQTPKQNAFETYRHRNDSQFIGINQSEGGTWNEQSQYGVDLDTTVKYTREGVRNNN